MTLKRHLLTILLLGLIGCFLGQTLFAETLAEAHRISTMKTQGQKKIRF